MLTPVDLIISSLSFQVDVADNLAQKMERLVPFLKKRTGPAIIYVTLQKQAQDVADELARRNLDAMVYHAGLPNEQRARIQQQFMASDKGIVCATIAFGMGIDKGMVRLSFCHFWTDIMNSQYSAGGSRLIVLSYLR